jgi:hypothetical protein
MPEGTGVPSPMAGALIYAFPSWSTHQTAATARNDAGLRSEHLADRKLIEASWMRYTLSADYG